MDFIAESPGSLFEVKLTGTLKLEIHNKGIEIQLE